MASNTVANPTPRVTRGIALYREHGDEIEHIGHGRYEVPGCSGGSYTVDLAPLGGEESCTCPDHQLRQDTCKHLIAATIYRAKKSTAMRRESAARRQKRIATASVL